MVTVECLCPPDREGGVRHPDGDTIELKDHLDFAGGRTARNIIAVGKAEGTTTPEIMAELSAWYVTTGVRAWSVVDGNGKPVEPTRDNVRTILLERADTSAATAVADAADELYSEAVINPLLDRGSNSSPPTPTNGSTSATNGSTSQPRKPSKRSSTTTTRTADTVTISSLPVGVSSSSQNSA